MKYKPFGLGLYVLVIAVLLLGSGALIAAGGPRAALSSGLEDIPRIKDAFFPGNDRLAKIARLEELARMKDDMFPDEREARVARLEELARIKDDVFPADDRPARISRLEELARTRDAVFPPGAIEATESIGADNACGQSPPKSTAPNAATV